MYINIYKMPVWSTCQKFLTKGTDPKIIACNCAPPPRWSALAKLTGPSIGLVVQKPCGSTGCNFHTHPPCIQATLSCLCGFPFRRDVWSCKPASASRLPFPDQVKHYKAFLLFISLYAFTSSPTFAFALWFVHELCVLAAHCFFLLIPPCLFFLASFVSFPLFISFLSL